MAWGTGCGVFCSRRRGLFARRADEARGEKEGRGSRAPTGLRGHPSDSWDRSRARGANLPSFTSSEIFSPRLDEPRKGVSLTSPRTSCSKLPTEQNKPAFSHLSGTTHATARRFLPSGILSLPLHVPRCTSDGGCERAQEEEEKKLRGRSADAVRRRSRVRD